jgi:hypothetical protein
VSRLIKLSLLALLIAVCWCPTGARAVVYGAEIDGDFDYYVGGVWGRTQLESSLTRLQASGASVARSSAEWAKTEPWGPLHGRFRYDWRYDDMVVTALATAHLRWEPTLDFTPKWAQEHIKPVVSRYHVVSQISPANYLVYSAYAAAFARRYGVGGSFWASHPKLPREPVTMFEIWNEPDCRWTWGPDVNLQHYARLYTFARQAIKRVDPHSAVITGGLAFTASSLPRLLKALEGAPVDGVAIHPYGPDAAYTISQVKSAQAQMRAYGRGATSLIVNEYGWDANRAGWQALPKRVVDPERVVDRDVIQSVLGLSKIRQVAAIIPFEWTDASWGLNDGSLGKAIGQARGLIR